MAGGALTPIDWAAPWYAPWRCVGEPVAQRLHAGLALPDALNGSPAPVRFVDQDQLPAGSAYEQFVFETRCCPVRPGLHDFFNGLCWHAFPRAKAAMNALQAAEIARAGIAGRRGLVRDAITVFDENGALLHAPSALWEALLAREWRRLFVELRPLWAQARLVVFGHALLEKLVAPRKDLTAHVWCMDAPPGMVELDGWLAAQITGERLAAKPFTPLPVLGVPGWWAQNAAHPFYDDPLVFRPRRPATGIPTAEPAGVARP
jgi:hypothetical protein